MNKKAEQLAEDYVENCKWQEFIYEDKSKMSSEEQKQRPSSIPDNIKIAFLAGYAARDSEVDKLKKAYEVLREACESINCSDEAIFGKWVTDVELRDRAKEALQKAEELLNG